MSVTHSTFTLERTYDASPARVFAAFADPEQKAAWFAGPPEWPLAAFEVDFRVGGREINRGGPKDARCTASRPSTTTSCRTSGSSTRTR